MDITLLYFEDCPNWKIADERVAVIAAERPDVTVARHLVETPARRGHAKALGAVQHSILVSIFHILDRDEPYRELGADYFAKHHNPERRARRLITELTTLGYTVTAEPPTA